MKSEGKPLLLKFRYDRVPPGHVQARGAETGTPVEVFESSFGTFVVQPTEVDEAVSEVRWALDLEKYVQA